MKNFIQRWLAQIAARQLRRPSGILAAKTGNEMNKTNAALYELTIDIMALKDQESILEIGFGNGAFFNKIFDAASNLEVAGIDFSQEMVRSAIARNQAHVAAGRLRLQLGSSDRLPFADGTFDKVFCINVIYFWESPADHLREIHRVLKPGGTFYTSIRRKESLLKMPFSAYGFHAYDEKEWIDVLAQSDFAHNSTRSSQHEPDALFGGKRYKAESLCLAAHRS